MLSPLKGAKPGGLPEHLACVTSPNLEVQSVSGVAHILMQHLQARVPHSLELRGPASFLRAPPLPSHSIRRSALCLILRCAAFPWASADLFIPSSYLGQPEWFEKDLRVQGRVDEAFFSASQDPPDAKLWFSICLGKSPS